MYNNDSNSNSNYTRFRRILKKVKSEVKFLVKTDDYDTLKRDGSGKTQIGTVKIKLEDLEEVKLTQIPITEGVLENFTKCYINADVEFTNGKLINHNFIGTDTDTKKYGLIYFLVDNQNPTERTSGLQMNTNISSHEIWLEPSLINMGMRAVRSVQSLFSSKPDDGSKQEAGRKRKSGKKSRKNRRKSRRQRRR
jgi:hypothetical protein